MVWGRASNSEATRPYVNTDTIETLGRDELEDYLGALSPATMDKVNRALTIALGLP